MVQMRKIQMGHMHLMVDRQSTCQQHVQAANAAQKATNAASSL